MKKVGEDLGFDVYLTSHSILLTIGKDQFTLTKTEAAQLAVKLVLISGMPAKLPGAPDQPLVWDASNEFVRLYRQELNEFGDFS